MDVERRNRGAAAIALLLTFVAGCGSDDQDAATDSAPTPSRVPIPSATPPSEEPLGVAALGLRYYSRVGGADDALGVQVDASTGQDTAWSTFGGACVENCAATIDLVGATSGGVPTMLWAGRNIEQRDDGKTVWAVTDVLTIEDDLEVFGTYDCASGVPLVDASNAIVMLLTVDLESGRFVEMAVDDGHCSVVGE